MKVKSQTLQNLREDYQANRLSKTDVTAQPIQQFDQWFKEALNAEIKEPNAMILSTVNSNGQPSARTVLLKGMTESGFIFYTNYNSQKGQEMAVNQQVALTFLWLDLQRQIRIEGLVEKMSYTDSQNYFQSRPKGSQIGAWASPQSEVIADRSILENNVETLKKQYAEVEQLPCPEHWGGYIVRPTRMEFWQGRSSRLHDRILYTLENEDWKIERLAP